MTLDLLPSTGGNAPMLVHTATTRSLADWAADLNAAHKIATAICATAFVPQHFRNKPDEGAAAILRGQSLGLDPMQSLAAFYVVNGNVGMAAETMVALLISHGHSVWTEDSSDEAVTVAGHRRGSERVQKVTITIDQAKRAGWATGQNNYSKTPSDMLYARAATRLCRRVAPDSLRGIPSIEDAADLPPIEATATVGARPVTIASLTAPAAVRSAEPVSAQPATEPDGWVEPGEQKLSGPQSKKLHTLLGLTGRSVREVGLDYLSGLLGRDITTSKDLTRREANVAIDDLEAQIAAAEEVNAEAAEQTELEP